MPNEQRVIVVDASVLANALIDKRTSGAVARDRLRAEAIVAAPDLIDVETLSALRSAWLRGSLSDERLELVVDELLEIPITRFASTRLLPRAASLRAELTGYDAVYVALAEGLGCTLLTGDQRLANAPGPRCRFEALTI